MDFKDYYATLGVEPAATQDEVKRAYRKLARKYHPDVSKEADAEARFKEVAEAHEALIDPERRAAYDDIRQRHAKGRPFEPPPGWDTGYEYSGRGPGDEGMPQPDDAAFSEFFETLFGRMHAPTGAGRGHPRHPAGDAHGGLHLPGADHHAKIDIDLQDVWHGAQRTVSLRLPMVDAQGRTTLRERRLDVAIPRGIRAGQHLRLAGQGGPGLGDGPAGDLYLEIRLRPHPTFRVEGRDVYLTLPVAPWEAALGATVTAPTPGGEVQLTIPPGSRAGRKLRLQGRGLPGASGTPSTPSAGDLYAVLAIALPPATSDAARAAYQALEEASAGFNPRAALQE